MNAKRPTNRTGKVPAAGGAMEKPRIVLRFVDHQGRFGAGASMQRFSQAGIELQKYLRWPLNAWTAPEAAFKLALDRLRQYPNFIELQGAEV